MAENQNGGKKKRSMSPETRRKLSELAKQRHREGKFGGAKYGKMGGRPRKERASTRVAEAARADKEAKKIIQVFKDAIDPSQPMHVRLKAAQAWIEIEREDAKLSIQQDNADREQHSRDELISMLAKKLTEGATGMILRRQLEEENIRDAEVVEGEVVERDEECD